MVDTEFWYAEGGSRAEGRARSMSQSKRWWLPSPQVPTKGLSEPERKKLLHQAKVVHQVFKAARAINENVLLEMPVPTIIREAFAKASKLNFENTLNLELHNFKPLAITKSVSVLISCYEYSCKVMPLFLFFCSQERQALVRNYTGY